MNALTIVPNSLELEFQSPEKIHFSDRVRDRVREIIQFVLGFASRIAEMPADSPLWPILLALAVFALTILAIYITGATHVAAGP